MRSKNRVALVSSSELSVSYSVIVPKTHASRSEAYCLHCFCWCAFCRNFLGYYGSRRRRVEHSATAALAQKHKNLFILILMDTVLNKLYWKCINKSVWFLFVAVRYHKMSRKGGVWPLKIIGYEPELL